MFGTCIFAATCIFRAQTGLKGLSGRGKGLAGKIHATAFVTDLTQNASKTFETKRNENRRVFQNIVVSAFWNWGEADELIKEFILSTSVEALGSYESDLTNI